MTPTLQGTPVTVAGVTGTATYNLPAPTGVVLGELLMVWSKVNNVTKLVTDWGGFNEIDQITGTGAGSAGVAWKVADSTDVALSASSGNYTLTYGTATGTVSLTIQRINGQAATSFIHAFQSTTSAVLVSAQNLTGVTTTVPNCLILWSGSFQGANGASTSWSGAAVDANEFVDFLNGTNTSFAATWNDLPSAGATGTGVATLASTPNNGFIGYCVAIAPDTTPTESKYFQLGADGAGKKERSETMVVGSDTVHLPHYINTSEVADNQTPIQNTPGTPTSYGLAVRIIEEEYPNSALRTARSFYVLGQNSSTTDTMLTLTPTSDFVTGSTGSSFTVTAGKTFKVQGIMLSGRVATATSPPTFARLFLRVNPSGATTTASPAVLSVQLPFPGGALAQGSTQWVKPYGPGMQIPAGHTFGLSLITMTGTAARTIWDAYLVGYEY